MAQSGDEIPDVRRVMLEVIADLLARNAWLILDSETILNDVAARIAPKGKLELEQAILTVWYDLFRNGLIAPGVNLNARNLPQCHLTSAGREMLKHVSRDPSNPVGYMEYLRHQGPIGEIALSYVEEALHTYNSNCFKAAAVMIGAAAERLVLDVRDALVKGIKKTGRNPAKSLTD
jgi:hypothetical protein